jgi:hypothetical protein
MKTNIGLWIDHRKAVIVSLTDSGENLREVPSHMEKHVRYSGGAADVSGEDQRDMRFADHLARFYEKVIARIRNADAILILGPGEAKGELKARLEHESLGGSIVGIETADKMTDRQIAALVRSRFLHSKKEETV